MALSGGFSTGTDVVYDVFCGDACFVDMATFQLWIQGVSESRALQRRASGMLLSTSDLMHNTQQIKRILLQDTEDQYRLFTFLLEPLLKDPPRLKGQLVVSLDTVTEGVLLEMYYQFDGPVWRRMLGKKLTSSMRKELAEISDETAVKVRSCGRQFDNLRAVFDSVLHSCVPVGSVAPLVVPVWQHIRDTFCISGLLAWRYHCAVFLLHHKFQMHGGRSRRSSTLMNLLTWKDLAGCATLMMVHWCPHPVDAPLTALQEAGILETVLAETKGTSSVSTGAGAGAGSGAATGHGASSAGGSDDGTRSSTFLGDFPTFTAFAEFYFRDGAAPRVSKLSSVASDADVRLAFDPALTLTVCQVKQRLLNTKDKRTRFADVVSSAVGTCFPSGDEARALVVSLTRALSVLADGLCKTERRGFFEDLAHKVIAPLLEAEVNQAQVAALFFAIASSFPASDATATRIRGQWRRFLGVVLLCVRFLMPLFAFRGSK